MNIVEKRLDELTPYENNPRKNESAIPYVAESIKRYGFKVPIVIDTSGVIVAGHTRYLASIELGLDTVPCIIADDLTEEEIKEYRLVDNKVSEFAGWDFAMLEEELQELDFDAEAFGFELNNIDEDPADIKEVDYHENISVVVECDNDEEAEEIFTQLTEEGYRCRISTL